MNSQHKLFDPVQLGDVSLPNRVVLTAYQRFRSDPKDHIPRDNVAKYYSLRASAGLIVTGCIQITDVTCYSGTEGLYNEEQVKGWQNVVNAVHEKGGRIFAQIWHPGRRVHPIDNQGRIPAGPSAVQIRPQLGTCEGLKEYPTPTELTEEEIQQLIQWFRQGAENAKKAGFDGVQIHGANGYIIDQFLRDWTNRRTDKWGGSLENRTRLCLAVIDELIAVFGSGRVSIKLSPVGRMWDMADSDPVKIYGYLLERLSERNLAFVEVMNWDPTEDSDPEITKNHPVRPSTQCEDIFRALRPHYKGNLVINMLQDMEKAGQYLEDGTAQAISYGRLQVCHPNLVEDLREGKKLNWNPIPKYLMEGGDTGYLDLSVYEETQ